MIPFPFPAEPNLCSAGRQHVIEDKTRAWLETHFPGIFSSVLFGNHWGREGAQRSKLDMCREVDAALLIDDSIAYAAEAATAGISALLFGEYPWNGGLAAGAAAPAADSSPSGDAALPPGVHRAVSWLHVSELLGRMRFEPAGGFHAFPAPLFVCLGHSARGAVVPALPACVDAVTVSGPPGRNAVQCAAAVAAILEVQPRVALEGSGADAAVVFEAVRILLQGGPGGAPPPPRGGVSVSNVSTKATEGPPPRDGSPGGGPVPPVLSIRALVSRSPSYLRARFGEAQSLAAPGAGRGSGTITTRPRGVSGTADWSLRASVRAPPTPPSGSGSGAGIEQGLPVVSHARVPVQEGGAVESVGSGSASASGDSDGVRTPG